MKLCRFISMRLSFKLFFLIFLCSLQVYSVKVGKFYYIGVPEKLNTKNLTLPSDMVAMGEFIAVKKTSTSNSVNSGGASIFLIIDNSSSMYAQNNDKWGYRFSTSRAIVDSVYRINPACEMGLTVFNAFNGFCLADDPNIFVKMMPLLQTETNPIMQFLDQYGSFIILMKLNQTYSSKIGQKTGHEIMKYYLQTDTLTDPFSNGKYIGLRYKPSDPVMSGTQWSGGTNISAGFQAAKYAYRNTSYHKDKHFIIFFSDGDANMPANYPELQTLFIQGTETPTTFSIYLTPNDTAPQSIKTMTANIKKNGYSASNPFSNLWSIKSNQDSLMTLIKNNIFPVIFSTVISRTPKDLKVNGADNPAWLNNGFKYPDIFPLPSFSSPFTYVLTYDISKDSITANGTTTTHIKDTVTTTNYTAQLQTGAPTPDSTLLAYWDRSIGFYSGGTQITSGDNTLKSVEIRFSHRKIDTLYGYKDVTVIITNTASSVKEHESFSLTDNGSYFSCSVPVAAVASNPTPDNATVEHLAADNVVATFKNPALPLDTISAVLRFSQSTNIQIISYTYFDNSGDGLIDSIFAAVAGNAVTISADFQEIVDTLPLPPARNLKINTANAATGGIALQVTEQNALPQTWCTGADTARIKTQILLKNGGIIDPSVITFIDKMAPVIMSAHYVDSVKIGATDILTVTFSEPEINDVVKANPFKFLRLPSTVYDVSLSLLKQSTGVGTFKVNAITGVATIIAGDSIRINHQPVDNVSDKVQNNQANPNNIRRPIAVEIIKDGTYITKAVYYDRNADGHIDNIFAGFSGSVSLTASEADLVKNNLRLPDYRKFQVLSAVPATNGLLLTVEEQNENHQTFCTSQDVLVVKDSVVLASTNQVLYPNTRPITDSVAPVILRADYLDSVVIFRHGQVDSLTKLGTDLLTVVFSEPVNPVTQTMPFFYRSKQLSTIYRTLLTQRKFTGSVDLFRVDSILVADNIYEGDSIWINPARCVSDTIINTQDNEQNVRRTVTVHRDTVYIYPPYALVLRATLLDTSTELKIGSAIANLDGIQTVLSDPLVKVLGKEGFYKKIMIFTLEPDYVDNVPESVNFDAAITIYDALGNIVVKERRMVHRAKEPSSTNSDKKLIYIWNGRNENKRTVGSGEYLAIVKIDYVKTSVRSGTGSPFKTEIRKLFGGVK